MGKASRCRSHARRESPAWARAPDESCDWYLTNFPGEAMSLQCYSRAAWFVCAQVRFIRLTRIAKCCEFWVRNRRQLGAEELALQITGTLDSVLSVVSSLGCLSFRLSCCFVSACAPPPIVRSRVCRVLPACHGARCQEGGRDRADRDARRTDRGDHTQGARCECAWGEKEAMALALVPLLL